MTLDTILDTNDIEEEIKQLIREQAMLRASLGTGRETFEWNEHEFPSHARIPFVDLRKYSPAEQSCILQVMNDRLFYDDYVLNHRLLYRISIVRMNERDYRVLLACHHTVYDGMSGEYIQKHLTERLEYREAGIAYSAEAVVYYRNYVEKIMKGPTAKRQEVINGFCLNTYDQSARKMQAWLDNYTDGRLRNVCVEVPFMPDDGDRSSEFYFEASIQLIQHLCRQWMGEKQLDISLLLFHYGRRYEHNSFYDTVGVFIDILPFVLQGGREAHGTEIGKLLKKLSVSNINFTSFLYGNYAKLTNHKIAELIDPSSHSGIWFNFHGKVDSSRLDGINKLKKPAVLEIEGHHANQIFGLLTFSFDVIYTDEVYRLSLTGPFDMQADTVAVEIQNLICSDKYISMGAL